MIHTQSELFTLITTTKGWYVDFCSEAKAKQMKRRHKLGQLSQERYDELFFHFGYKRQLLWIKSE